MTVVRFAACGGCHFVSFAYNAEVVALIKATVPASARSWQRAGKIWSVDNGWTDPLAAALREHGHAVSGLEPVAATAEIDAAEWARVVFRRVGPHRCALAYRVLSRVCHPDHGGSHDLQLELNRAYAEVVRP